MCLRSGTLERNSRITYRCQGCAVAFFSLFFTKIEGLLLGHVHILLKFVCYNFFFVILLPLLLSSLYSFYLCILIQLFCSMKEGFLFFHFLAFRLVWYQSIDKICCNFSSPILFIFGFFSRLLSFFFSNCYGDSIF